MMRKNMMRTVFVERTETYYLPVKVEADSPEEAIEKVRRMDDDDAFFEPWCELQPDVETKYSGGDEADPFYDRYSFTAPTKGDTEP